MRSLLISMCLLGAFVFTGCGDSASSGDANKTPKEIRDKAQTMDASALQGAIDGYNADIKAKQAELDKVKEQLKGLTPDQLMGDDAKKNNELNASLASDVNTLQRNLAIYVEELAKKNAGN